MTGERASGFGKDEVSVTPRPAQAAPPLQDKAALPSPVSLFPELRYMGSKRRLLPWIHQVLSGLDFEAALDPFAGSGAVAYLMKAMGRRVAASDFLNVAATVSKALVENSTARVDARAMRRLLSSNKGAPDFIQRTFAGVFFSSEDLRFLDRVSANMAKLDDPNVRAIAMAALVRSCIKRQPRGVFTISGDLSHYDDGRRDLRLSIEEHFREQVEVYGAAVFSNGRANVAARRDVFEVDAAGADLVYLDPPYVPRADDNCYVKRYHFVEGLSAYWRGMGVMEHTKVKKIEKPYTPFSYRRDVAEAFARMFERFKHQTVVLSYGSNGYPDLASLVDLMSKTKRSVEVMTRPHRYHFGNHSMVKRAMGDEYLIVGR